MATPLTGGGVCSWSNRTSMPSLLRHSCGTVVTQAGARAVWSRPGLVPAPLRTWPAYRPHARGGLCTVVRQKIWLRAMADVVTHLPWAVCTEETHDGTTYPVCALV